MTQATAKISNSNLPFTTKGRGKIYNNIIETIGDTPLVKLNKTAEKAGAKAEIFAKLEFFNPLSSVKDRLALSMIEDAEKTGKLKKDSILVEPTSGNTGIALAFIAAAKGYKLILTMPESMSIERRKMLKILGAELELTEAAKGMKGAIAKAQEIVANNKNAVMLQQFENPSNPLIHRNTTANEVWNDTKGEVDIFICGVGTGGTLTGTAEVLKSKKPSVKIIAVEPEDSPVLSGGQAGPHKIQGIGAGFVPAILNTGLIDEIIKVSNEKAFETARNTSKDDGIPAGISSGATIYAALEVAKRPENAGKKIVVICASCAERYISTALFDF
ncbi:MAG: cysteine synthase A [Rickettsiales bacterium]|nr:cysteine synthase A [Rickettsiales bacterium]